MQELLGRVGRIFDIQRYSIHDGPGIRTVVFLKGCAFRCRWCCNPESQHYETESWTRRGKTETVGRDVTVAQVMETVLRDLPYYRRSGGGLTLSGGECLLQPDFAEGLLRAAKSYGIHTAIETTGFAEVAVLDRLLPHVDLVLMDIKHMDDAKHTAFCHQSNVKVLERARYIAEHAHGMTVRVPVIPTFNDTEAEISAIARFAATLKGVHHLHLLPYHRLGQDKYASLGRPYGMEGIEPLSDMRMQTLLGAAERHGLICQIGG